MKKYILYTVIAIMTGVSIQVKGNNRSIAPEIPVLENVLNATDPTNATTKDPISTPKKVTGKNKHTTLSSDPTAPNTAVSQDILTDQEGSTVASINLEAQTNVVSYLDFDASNDDFVQVNALQNDLNGTSRSAFMWIQTDTQVGGTPVFLFAINTSTGGNRALFGIEDNTIIMSGSGTDFATTAVTDGEWHHVGYTYDGTTFETKLYVDGVVEETITQNRTTTSSDQYSLGQEFDGSSMGNFYNGFMTEVSIWSTVLDQTEINLIRQSRIENTHPQYANLVGYYGYTNCDDPALVLADNSPAGNTGVLAQEEITETTLFETIPNFDSTGWYSPTWLENGVSFATTATTSVTPTVGATPYSLELTRDFVTITDNFTITGIAPEITYSGAGFTENPANNGSVSGSIDINLIGDTFASNPLTVGTDVTVGNIPEGLTPMITTATSLGDWTAQMAIEPNFWTSVTYGNGQFVAVSGFGTNQVMISPDGITWTPQTAAEQNFWTSVTYGNGQFVAVSLNGTNRVMTSPDGITWTARMAADPNSWESVTYGNEQFVAVAQDGTNRVMTSPDGITWTSQMATEQNEWRSVTYGNGQFVAVSFDGTNRVMTSPDGMTWTSQMAAETFNLWTSVTYGNGQFVAVSATGTNRVMTSPDGITWTSQTAAENNGWISVTYGNGQFVAVSASGTNRVMTSPDGITWTSQTAAEQNDWLSVTYGNGQFVAVSLGGTNQVMTASGQTLLATLSLTGNAINHQDSDDVSDITFEFADSAFIGGDAAAVINATGPASSNLGVDFLNNLLCAGITTTWDGTSWDNNAPTANDMAIINGDYNTDTHGNITACTLVVNSGFMLEVTDDTYVSVINDITIDGDLMVANAGSIVQVAEDAVTTNTGNIAVTKDTPALSGRDFVVLSSPMSAEMRTGVFQNANRVFEIQPALFTPHPDVTTSINFIDVNFDYFAAPTPIEPARGYLLFPQAPQINTSVVFNHIHTLGTLNSGTIDYPLTYNGPSTENNFNVVGNPYASAIDNDMLLTENEQISALYFWQHLTPPTASNPGDNSTNHSMDDVSVYNLMGGIAAVNGGSAPGQYMTSGQGFGVLADQDFDGEALTFTNAMRVTGNNGTVRSSETATAIDRIWITLEHEGSELQSTSLVGFTDQASAGFDAGYDSKRLNNTLSLFSTLDNGDQLGIQGRETFDIDMEINMGFQTLIPETANYTISIDQLEGANLEQSDVFLIDHILGVTTNLKETSYTFASSETIQENRFRVVFNEQVLSTDEFSLTGGDFKVYPNPANAQITVVNQNGVTIKELTITNVNGSIVKRIAVNSLDRQQTINISELSTGIYFMRVQTDSLIKNIKIIKR